MHLSHTLLSVTAIVGMTVAPAPGTGIPTAATVDVRSHGARLDGRDDSSALVAAIEALPLSGGTVLIPGILSLGRPGWAGIAVRGRSGVTIAGSDTGSGFRVLHRPSQTIQSGGGESVALLRVSDSDSVAVRGLDFDGNGVQTVFVALDNVSRSAIWGNRFHDTPEDMKTHRIAPAVQSNGGKANDYSGNLFRNVDYGLGLGGWGAGKGDADSSVRGNVFEDVLNDGVLIGGMRITVSGNKFCGCGRSAIIIGETHSEQGSSQVLVEGNTIRDCRWHGIQSDLTPPARLEQVTITGNTFDNNLLSGAFLHHMNRTTFTYNRVSRGRWGIAGAGVDGLTVEGNMFFSQTEAGIQLTQDRKHPVANITIRGNRIQTDPHRGAGIYIPAQSTGPGNRNADIRGNHVEAHGYALWIWNGLRAVIISGNVLRGGGADLRVDDEAYRTYGDNNSYSTWAGRKIGYVRDGKRHNFSAKPPDAGSWEVGDWFHREPPVPGKPIGWVCVEAGTPGKWVAKDSP